MFYKYDVLNLAWFLASKIKGEKAELMMVFAGGLFGVHTYERHKGVAPEQPDGPNVPKPFSSLKNSLRA